VKPLETRHGRIAITESRGTGAPVLCIHGNSACKEIFGHQLDGAIGRRLRVVAFDLPGHGQSTDAPDPASTYCFEGYAEVAAAVAHALDLDRPVVLGWSLGGHVAIDMLRSGSDVAGVLLTGTPPVGPEDLAQGFRPHPHMHLTGQEAFSEADVFAYARDTVGVETPFLEAAVRRTDGRARAFMLASALRPGAANQRLIVESTRVPTAVVTGANEPFVDNDYLERVRWGNLWENRVHRVAAAGHAPFFEQPAAFDALLERFVGSVSG
jgi:pimeloyl-ACP methyl ester carboxylesterase